MEKSDHERWFEEIEEKEKLESGKLKGISKQIR